MDYSSCCQCGWLHLHTYNGDSSFYTIIQISAYTLSTIYHVYKGLAQATFKRKCGAVSVESRDECLVLLT